MLVQEREILPLLPEEDELRGFLYLRDVHKQLPVLSAPVHLEKTPCRSKEELFHAMRVNKVVNLGFHVVNMTGQAQKLLYYSAEIKKFSTRPIISRPAPNRRDSYDRGGSVSGISSPPSPSKKGLASNNAKTRPAAGKGKGKQQQQMQIQQQQHLPHNQQTSIQNRSSSHLNGGDDEHESLHTLLQRREQQSGIDASATRYAEEDYYEEEEDESDDDPGAIQHVGGDLARMLDDYDDDEEDHEEFDESILYSNGAAGLESREMAIPSGLTLMEKIEAGELVDEANEEEEEDNLRAGYAAGSRDLFYQGLESPAGGHNSIGSLFGGYGASSAAPAPTSPSNLGMGGGSAVSFTSFFLGPTSASSASNAPLSSTSLGSSSVSSAPSSSSASSSAMTGAGLAGESASSLPSFWTSLVGHHHHHQSHSFFTSSVVMEGQENSRGESHDLLAGNGWPSWSSNQKS
jgi:hypothetical protein